MKKYDDYQKSMRYKYGYFSFLFLNSLLVLNYLLGLFFNLKWGATKELETMIILFVVGIFFANACVYQNAYFHKNDDKKSYSWLFLIIGGIGLYTTYQTYLISPEELIINGEIGRGAIQLFSGLMFVSIPLTYFIRNRIDSKRNKDQ
ncbi:MAG: hypothetical protein ABS862_02125 [Carnobacterium inhibens]|uniref:hypothetical protein n=1 Tax=Carnobacterium TaxID=2747 RepID=UPI000553725D|nr:hypothetical protein [Carnobacterium inhibens]